MFEIRMNRDRESDNATVPRRQFGWMYMSSCIKSKDAYMIMFTRECVATMLLRLRMFAESKHYYYSELKTNHKKITNDINYLLYLQCTRLHNYCNISLLLIKKNRELTK